MGIGHFSMSRPIKYFHYIYVFCTLSFFRLLISAAIRTGLTFCGQEGKGEKRKPNQGRIKVVELEEIENNICANFSQRFAMPNNLLTAKVFTFFGKGRTKGKWR